MPWAAFGTALCSVTLSTRQNTFYVTLETALFSSPFLDTLHTSY